MTVHGADVCLYLLGLYMLYLLEKERGKGDFMATFVHFFVCNGELLHTTSLFPPPYNFTIWSVSTIFVFIGCVR
jgi:hypothetical protein